MERGKASSAERLAAGIVIHWPRRGTCWGTLRRMKSCEGKMEDHLGVFRKENIRTLGGQLTVVEFGHSHFHIVIRLLKPLLSVAALARSILFGVYRLRCSRDVRSKAYCRLLAGASVAWRQSWCIMQQRHGLMSWWPAMAQGRTLGIRRRMLLVHIHD